MVSVKTSQPIPKAQVMNCMERINALRVKLPVSVGDILLEDVFGCQLVATQNRKAYGKA
jgi:CxxC motif-containing protein